MYLVVCVLITYNLTKESNPDKVETVVDRVKSPSDTTIYAPALRRMPERGLRLDQVQQNLFNQNAQMTINPTMVEGNSTDIEQMVANFVDNVRLEESKKGKRNDADPEVVQVNRPGTLAGPNAIQEDKGEYSRGLAVQMILDTEKYRGEINQPQGMSFSYDNCMLEQPASTRHFLGVNKENNSVAVLDDDDFMHITCHVDRVMTKKLSKGSSLT